MKCNGFSQVLILWNKSERQLTLTNQLKRMLRRHV